MRTLLACSLAFVVALSLATARSSHTASAESATTGVPEVDAALRDLEAHDVDALLARVEFRERPCDHDGGLGKPYCQPDVPVGTPVGSFLAQACGSGPYFDLSTDDVRRRIASGFAGAALGSVFAVARGSLSSEVASDYVVVLTPGAVASPTEDGTFWQITAAGKLVAVDVFDFCAPPGAVQQLRRYFPTPDFAIAPVMTCDPGPGESLDLVVQVEHVYGDATPQFWGHSGEQAGRPREIVHVEHTAWPGTVTSFGDARTGSVARVVGMRLADCTIDATSVAIPPTATPEPSATPAPLQPAPEAPIATPPSPPFAANAAGVVYGAIQLPSTGARSPQGSGRDGWEILAVVLTLCIGVAAFRFRPRSR